MIGLRKTLIIISLLWIALIMGSFFWNYTSAKTEQEKIAFQTAKSFFDLIVMTREWNAWHGGVYVPVTPETMPNPYLETPMRDIHVNEQLTLTQINPAYMTRQIAEIAEKQKISFHLTSLNPIRPQNKPSPREERALKAFERGVSEKGEFIEQKGKTEFFYMAPLKTKDECLKCHAAQGYQKGDIRGGIRVTLPFAGSIPMKALLLGHIGIGMLGLIGIIAGGRRLGNAYDTIRKQAKLDGLTGVANRRSFSERIAVELNRSRLAQEPLSLIMIDIDYFKYFNDHYGHEQGDQCLKKVARQICNTTKRPGDFCARYGGEEFVVLLPATPSAGAMHIAEEIRINIEKLEIPHISTLGDGIVTVSLGVATFEDYDAPSRETLLYKADMALYQAKHQGRNRVVCFSEGHYNETEK